ncbi:MAG: Asp-tRNA(Asn)/Glu-tRNA(Gln) amidotransferase subunit GatC [Thermoplasmatota archaeon]
MPARDPNVGDRSHESSDPRSGRRTSVVDAQHIRHLAGLAKLELTDAEVAAFAAEGTRILELFDSMPHAEAETSRPLLAHEGRPDVAAAQPAEVVEAILGQVARRDGKTIVVPRGGGG